MSAQIQVPWLVATNRRFIRIFAPILAAILIIILYFTTHRQHMSLLTQRLRLTHSISAAQATTNNQSISLDEVSEPGLSINATLGFEKVFAINLPERTDRRDTLTLMSIHQDIQIDWIDAVRGSDIDPKARPPHWKSEPTEIDLAELGCWRSHLNVLRHIVGNRISTALILEDDADWDIAIKSQLTLLAEHLPTMPASDRKSLTQESANASLGGSYGSSWDVLFLGTVANPPAPDGTPAYLDPTTQRTNFLWEVSEGVAGSLAYAVTYESAKALYTFMLDIRGPYDFRLGDFCATRRCPLIWPTLVLHHEAAGNRSKSSDIQDDSDSFQDVASTPGLDHSAILDMLGTVA